MKYFTSDPHFGHENIIEYCSRPFKDVWDMNDTITAKWNERVRREDDVYVLGDFTLQTKGWAKKYFSRLNGRIFVLGDLFTHDKYWLPMDKSPYLKVPVMGYSDLFMSATGHKVCILPPLHSLEIPVGKKHDLVIALCHFPQQRWDRSHYGSLHLHGHVHNAEFEQIPNRMNAGVDTNDFYPYSLDEILKELQ